MSIQSHIQKALTHVPGAQRKLFNNKNRGRKSRSRVSLILIFPLPPLHYSPISLFSLTPLGISVTAADFFLTQPFKNIKKQQKEKVNLNGGRIAF
jgi:hypothetical protein